MLKWLLGSADKLIDEGNRAEQAGNLPEACARYRDAVRVAPRYAKAHLNLGIGLEASGEADAAIATFRAALALEPAEPFANYNLGRLLYLRGALQEAERLLRQALRAKPDFFEARIVLASLHARLSDLSLSRGELAAAAAQLEQVVALRPEWADAHFNHGCTLMRLVRPTDAEAAFRRAIAADSAHRAAYRMLGGVLRDQCRTEEALELYRRARERFPEDFELGSAELYVRLGAETESEEALFARHRSFGEAIEQAYRPRFEAPRNPADPDRPLRIGYVSADFRYHVVTLFMLPVLERHDRARFQVYCYSATERPDDYTRKLAAQADVWRDCASMSPEQLAERIQADAIDVLVDLSGHSGIPRLRAFALRPAPVQATWLGYLGTTGMTRMDYRITDAVADPPGMTEAYHSETLARLPHSQWCYRPFITVEPARTPPCVASGRVTFGSFNQAAKLSPSARRLWAAILRQVPDSRLVVAGVAPGHAQDALRRDLAQAGIAQERITLLPYVSLEDYFRTFASVDIALDTMPYSGGTTTCDALWMGVPVITNPGPRPASRSAASILSTVGLTDWIAPTEEEYVRRAVRFAGDRELLAQLRAGLRERVRASPLVDEARFASDLEALYRWMWRRWCAAR